MFEGYNPGAVLPGRRRRHRAASRAVRVPDPVRELRGARAHRARRRDDRRGVLRAELRRARARRAHCVRRRLHHPARHRYAGPEHRHARHRGRRHGGRRSSMLGIAWVASRSMRRPVVTGTQAMIGATAEAFEDFASTAARCASAVSCGTPSRSAPVANGPARAHRARRGSAAVGRAAHERRMRRST